MKFFILMDNIRKVLFVCFSIFILAGCARPLANRDSGGSNIICFGDSITEGVGAASGEDYPFVLSTLLGLPVINAGVRGDTTEEALLRIEGDVLIKDPKLVVVILGGNDALKNIPLSETVGNLERIVSLIQEAGAMVVLSHVKVGLISDRYHKSFLEIANRKQAMFMGDIMKGIMFNPAYKYDGIHPNAKGYRKIAERIYKRIKPLVKE